MGFIAIKQGVDTGVWFKCLSCDTVYHNHDAKLDDDNHFCDEKGNIYLVCEDCQ